MTTLAIQIDPPQDTLQRVILTGRLSTHTHQDLDAALSPCWTPASPRWCSI